MVWHVVHLRFRSTSADRAAGSARAATAASGRPLRVRRHHCVIFFFFKIIMQTWIARESTLPATSTLDECARPGYLLVYDAAIGCTLPISNLYHVNVFVMITCKMPLRQTLRGLSLICTLVLYQLGTYSIIVKHILDAIYALLPNKSPCFVLCSAIKSFFFRF